MTQKGKRRQTAHEFQNESMELLDHTFIRYPNNMTLWPKYENSFGSQSNFYIPLPSRFLGVVQNTKPHLFPRSLEDVSSSGFWLVIRQNRPWWHWHWRMRMVCLNVWLYGLYVRLSVMLSVRLSGPKKNKKQKINGSPDLTMTWLPNILWWRYLFAGNTS